MCSMMTVPTCLVASSISRFMVTPSMMSRNSTLPAFSVRMETLYGSHCTKVSPFFTLAAVRHGDDRADDHGVAFQLAAVVGVDADGAVLVEDDVIAVERLDGAEVGVLHRTLVARLDLRLLEDLRRRATDVERTHGQLRAGLADRLRGDDADRLAELGQRVGGERDAVALRADAAAGLAGEHGADLDPLGADIVDRARS